MELAIPSLSVINEVARQFLAAVGDHNIIAFYGEMGAGKTTFIRALCQQLGVDDVVTSPTFAILNEYTTPNSVVYHCDCYRLSSADEFLDIGGEDYLSSGNLCFIEWPERIECLLPQETLHVRIMPHADGSRTIHF